MKRKEKMDTLMYEQIMNNSLNAMGVYVQQLKNAIDKGTQIKDKLLLSQKNEINLDNVREIVEAIYSTVRKAKTFYAETREFFDKFSFMAQDELLNAKNMDSTYYQALKKVRTKTTDAKQTLNGYNINGMEELAYKTVEAIIKASEEYYSSRVK